MATADDKYGNDAAELRRKAEEKVLSQPAFTGEMDTERLLQELQVHQVELEMQNEELRLANQALKEYELHMQNVIMMTPAGYFHLDTDDRFVDVNDAWLKMHRYESREEVIGKHFSLLQVDSTSDSALKHLAELHRGMPIPLGDFTSRRKDGSVGHHIFSAHPVLHAGRIVGFEWFIIDISERKRLEEENGILQQQFQQAQKLESLGVLAGGIAHDFNNILAIIMGYCGLTKMDYDTAEKHIPIIENAVERAAGLCRQMLAYAGKASLTQTLVVMWVLVDDVVMMLKATIGQNVVIKATCSKNLPSIMGDANQLRQIVMNLIINASEAIGEGQGEVCVSLSKAVMKAGQQEKDHCGKIIPQGKYVCLDVTDSGCGMDNESKRRIFEPFYTTKFTGRGLGMSAVLGIITAHGGTLQLFSQPGHGTTFKVYLPAQVSATTEEKTVPQTVPTPWKGSGTILLAEDEELVTLIVKTVLESLGFKVIEAADGKEALELYKKNAADITLVMADMGMPVMDGYEMFRELKKLKPKLPIIVSSGFGDAEVTSRIPREEIAALVSKPYNFENLREVLKGVVEAV